MRLLVERYGLLRGLEVDFPEGITVVAGGNGSGKSSLLEAFLWAFYGDARVRLTEAEVQAEVGEFRCLRRVSDGRSEARAHGPKGEARGVREVGRLLEESGWPSLATLLATTWAKQDSGGFINLPPLQRRAFLADVMRLERWEAARARIKNDLGMFQHRHASLLGRLQGAQEERERIAALLLTLPPESQADPGPPPSSRSLAEIERLRQEHDRLTALAARREELEARFKQAQAASEALAGLRLAEEALQAQALALRELEHQAATLRREIAQAEAAALALAQAPCRDLPDLPERCRFVAQARTTDREALARELAGLEERIRGERTRLGQARDDVSARREELERLAQPYEALRRQLEQAQEAQARLPEASAALANAGDSLALERWQAASRAHLRRQELDQQRQRLEQEIAQQEIEARTLARQVELLRRIEQDFSPKGVPGYLIESALPEIEETAQAYLDALSDGYRLGFSLERERARGGSSETLDALVEQGGVSRPIEACSGGERVLVDLALRLALSRYLRGRGVYLPEVLVLDETLAPLDEENRGRVLRVLERLNEVRRLVVISHVADVRELPGHVIELGVE